MAKDPAFLFYPGDWLGGTMGFSFELKGCYFELLIYQFNSGGKFTQAQAKQVLNGSFDVAWPLLQQKFSKVGNFYFNRRLREEVERRKAFSESRRINGLAPKKSKKNKKAYAKHTEAYAKHMEATNENENTIKNIYAVYNAEDEILKNKIEFERICISVGSDFENAKSSLHKYHLFLEEKEQYPKGKKAVFAGFEKWLLNEKKFNVNGSTRQLQESRVVGRDPVDDKL